MLTDPLVVKSLSINTAAITVTGTDSYATIDAGDGRSRRVCNAVSNTVLLSMRGELTIAHSVSNENKPALTDRTLVRHDFVFPDKEGKELKGYAYVVIGIPRGIWDAGNEEIASPVVTGIAMTSQLIGTLAVNPASANLSSANLARILAGEP